jgi:hypothetical protein
MNVVETLVEVVLKDEQNFLKIKETLTRIGIAASKEKKLYQSCHILHKQGKYYIVHFKELFALDGKQTNFNDEDKSRRNTIVTLIEEWDLVEIVKPEDVTEHAPMSQIKIIPFKDKANWELISKYQIGRKKV